MGRIPERPPRPPFSPAEAKRSSPQTTSNASEDSSSAAEPEAKRQRTEAGAEQGRAPDETTSSSLPSHMPAHVAEMLGEVSDDSPSEGASGSSPVLGDASADFESLTTFEGSDDPSESSGPHGPDPRLAVISYPAEGPAPEPVRVELLARVQALGANPAFQDLFDTARTHVCIVTASPRSTSDLELMVRLAQTPATTRENAKGHDIHLDDAISRFGRLLLERPNLLHSMVQPILSFEWSIAEIGENLRASMVALGQPVAAPVTAAQIGALYQRADNVLHPYQDTLVPGRPERDAELGIPPEIRALAEASHELPLAVGAAVIRQAYWPAMAAATDLRPADQLAEETAQSSGSVAADQSLPQAEEVRIPFGPPAGISSRQQSSAIHAALTAAFPIEQRFLRADQRLVLGATAGGDDSEIVSDLQLTVDALEAAGDGGIDVHLADALAHLGRSILRDMSLSSFVTMVLHNEPAIQQAYRELSAQLSGGQAAAPAVLAIDLQDAITAARAQPNAPALRTSADRLATVVAAGLIRQSFLGLADEHRADPFPQGPAGPPPGPRSSPGAP